MRLVTVLPLVIANTARAGDLRIGTASVDIMPPQGVPTGGCFSVRQNTGVHDPLHAEALVLEKEDDKAALVVCDLESVLRSTTLAARQAIEQRTGLRRDRGMKSSMPGASLEVLKCWSLLPPACRPRPIRLSGGQSKKIEPKNTCSS
jgi:hypothetical protein